MLHNEAREFLVQGYEATHDAKGIAKAYCNGNQPVCSTAVVKGTLGNDLN